MSRICPDIPCKGENPEKEDLLGYYPFAEMLANGIYLSQASDGLVIALYGSWGIGKSTLLNFIEHTLNKIDAKNEEKKVAIIVRFNPWWFSGRESLSRDLINQIAITLCDDNKIKANVNKLREILHKYACLIGSSVDLLGTATGIVTAGIGKALGEHVTKITEPPEPPNIPQLKTEISDLLAANKAKIVVFVDDIDRLNPGEICELFTVIKALADFPNVIYLMAFDKEIVGSALKNELKYDNHDEGVRFLQKMVQVEFEMPLIDGNKIADMLIANLSKVAKDSLYTGQYQNYWSEVFVNLRHLFVTPRDIVRFTNAISVTYPAIENQVNIVDFIAIEAIRIFAPKLYTLIKNNPDQFAARGNDCQNYPTFRKTNKEQFDTSWKSVIPTEIRRNTESLILKIFPTLNHSNLNTEEIRQWANELKICHREIFPIYFKYSLPESMVTKSDIQELYTLSSEEIMNQLLQYKRASNGKEAQAIERIMQLVEEIPLENIHNFAVALLSVGDELIMNSDTIWFFQEIITLTLEMIRRVLPKHRKKIIKAIEKGDSFTIPLITVSRLLLEQPKIQENFNSITPIPIDVINKLIVQIKNKMKNKLTDAPHWIPPCLPNVLEAWVNIGDKVEAKKYCQRQIDSNDYIIDFLLACRSESYSYSEQRKELYFNSDVLSKFINFGECVNKLKLIEKDAGVSEDVKKVIDDMERFIIFNQND